MALFIFKGKLYDTTKVKTFYELLGFVLQFGIHAVHQPVINFGKMPSI